jgi:anti-sigma B factor antagonist
VHWTHIGERAIGDVVVLKLEGHMTLDTEEKQLRDVVNDLIATGRTKIVLDLESLPYVDSVGIGEIVRAYSAVVRAGGAFGLAGPTPRVREVLDATQLAPVLGVCLTVGEAIDRLQRRKTGARD